MSGKWRNLKKMIEYPNEGILSKQLFIGESSETTLFLMAAGAEMSEHTSTREANVYVLEGKGTFSLGGEEIAMEPGVIICMEKNAVHSLAAKENTSFILFLSD